MSSMELTIITGVAFILFALERVYARRTGMMRCLERIEGLLEGLLTELKDDARERLHDLIRNDLNAIENSPANSLTSTEGYLASIDAKLNDIDIALHGDYTDLIRKKLNCLSNIEDYLGKH